MCVSLSLGLESLQALTTDEDVLVCYVLVQLSLCVESFHTLLAWEVRSSSGLCFGFLGGLSLHLNHLIAERVSAHYWQFGTLPIGIFLSNLDSGQLETSLMTSYCHF